MKKRRIIVAGATGAFSLIIALPAFAEPLPPRTQATFGVVTSVEGDSFTLEQKRPEGDAQLTVSLTEDTTLKKSGIAAEDASIEPGQQVVVRGTPDQDGLIASSVNIMPQ